MVGSARLWSRTLLLVLLVSALAAGCGKKGSPLPPLQRIPVAPPDLSLTRIDQDVYAQFKIPTVNIDGVGPADVARVELYAVTADAPPQGEDPEDLRRLSTLVGSEVVRSPVPPPPRADAQPPVPLPPPGPGLDQGAAVVFRERLTPEMRTPVALPEDERARERDVALDVPRPLVAPPDTGGPQRFYYAVAVSRRGRYGPATPPVAAPLGPTSAAPGELTIAVDENSVKLTWAAPADARGVVAAGDPAWLPSRPIVPGPEPTTYDVYEVPGNQSPSTPTIVVPAPLTPAPVGTLEFAQTDIALGAERCFVVRPVDIVSGVHVRGPASPVVCAAFADTYPPAPATKLESIATNGLITLLWEGSAAKDLAGYIVLRGEAGNATLTPLTPAPIAPTTYRDDTVRPGVRYLYAIVAVDKAGNRSEESNRVEETARP